MLRLALLSTLVASSLAAEFSTTASFTVKVGKTKKVETILLLLSILILIIIFTIMTKITMVTINTIYSRPPAATSQFLMTELLLAKPIAQPPAQWPGKHLNPFELSSFVNHQ